MEIEKVMVTSNYKYGNFTVTMGKSRNVFNLTADIRQELLKFPVYASFAVPLNDEDREYQRNILKVTINVCRMFNGVGADFISKMVGSELIRIAKLSKIPLKCPFAKRVYEFNNFEATDKFFPPYLIKNLKFVANFKAMAKVADQSKLVPLFNGRIYGILGKE